MTHQISTRGFTLVETLVATGLLVTAIVGLAHLFAMSVRFTRDSGQFGAALVAAQDKLESLRALRLGYDDNGNAVTDPRLRASPQTSLDENIEGHFDWLDLSGGVTAQRGAAFVRRWRVTEIDQNDPVTLAIDVCVYEWPSSSVGSSQAAACLGAVRVRQP
jgi:type II secretory pathway pseudopilin PulG